MNYHKFLRELPDLYQNWDEDSVNPRSSEFQSVLDTLQSMTTANVMQLLNFAVDCMAEDEIYCEVGTYQGSTLIGALLNHPDKVAYAVDNFSEYDPQGDNLAQLMDNLEQFHLQEQVYFCEQDCQDFFCDLREAGTSDRIGVYFYDGSHDYRSQLMGLMLARDFLADQALIIIDDANWQTTKQAIWDFLALNSKAEFLLELPTPIARHPSFWNGLVILSWDCQKTTFYTSLDLQKQQQKQVIKAIYNLQMIEQQDSGKADYLTALKLHRQGDLILAEKHYRNFLLWHDQDFGGWYNLGTLYYETERYQSAASAFVQAHTIDASFIDIYNNLGNSLVNLGKIQEAVKIYRQGIAIDPTHFGCYLNLGNLFLVEGYLQQAIATYQTGLEFNPDNSDLKHSLKITQEQQTNPDILLSLGNKFYAQGDYSQAIDIYTQLLSLEVTTAGGYFYLGDSYKKNRDYSQAIKIFEDGIQKYPFDSRLRFALIMQLQQYNRIEEAISQAEIATDLMPQDYIFQLLSNLLVPLIYTSLEEIRYYRQRYEEGLAVLAQTTSLDSIENVHSAFLGISSITNFYLTYQGDNIKDIQVHYGKLLGKIMLAKYPAWVKPLPLRKLGENQRIKVGYVSAYFYSYSGTYWLQGWLKHHNHDRLEIYCYHTSHVIDEVTENFRKCSHTFHHIPDNFEATCQQILRDELHILIFPEIGMDAPTMAMAGLRLAPVQCTDWGHPVTTGLSTIDYFISSELMEADNAQNHYSETLIKLPNIGVSYPQPAVENLCKQKEQRKREDFHLREGDVAYLCCQAPFKYLPQHDYLLAAIAQAVPQAKFIFIRSDILKPRLTKAFEMVGLSLQDYCIFLPPLPRNDYLTLNCLSDIYLDTIGFTGGNTTLDAIACSLPVVTMPTELMRGRLSYGILRMIGVEETIAKTLPEYLAVAIKLGQDTPWRHEIKAKIQHSRSRAFDDRTCVEALEEFFYRVVKPAES